MIDKTRLGISFFDQRYGGIHRKRAALCTGRHGSGKTLVALQALVQSVHEGERGLMLSAWRAQDLAAAAAKMGLPLSAAIAKGQVILLEYAQLITAPELEKNLTLPPGSFMEFQDIVESHGVSRVVIDTVLPWVAIPQEDRLARHVYSFIQAIERMGVTALLTLPKPASALAFALKSRLEEQVPVVFTLDVDGNGRHTLLLNKYLGESNLPPPVPFIFAPGVGILRAPKVVRAPPPGAAAPAAPAAKPAGNQPIRFASAFKT